MLHICSIDGPGRLRRRRRYCLGAPLARLEARVVLTDLARRLAEPAVEELTYRENRVLRGPQAMVLSGGIRPA